MTAEKHILGFHRIDERFRDADRHRVQCLLFTLEFLGAKRHLLANEDFHVSPFDLELPPVRHALDRALHIG